MPNPELCLNQQGDNTMTRGQFLGSLPRLFLVTLLFPTVLSCSKLPVTEKKLNIPEGVWDKEAVVAMAQSMLGEDVLNDIAFAGHILLGNQEGKPTFSDQDPVFVNDPVKIETAEVIPSPYPNINAVAAARFRPVGDNLKVILKSRGQAEDQNLSAPQKVQMERIILVKSKLVGLSLLGIKFLIAKEIYNLKAGQILVDKVLARISARYVLPTDPSELNAVKVGLREQTMVAGGYSLPMGFAGDFLAHFLIVPNYLTAKEAGRLNSVDLRTYDIVDQSADYFKRMGILYKENGKYRWSQDEKMFVGWMDALIWLHRGIYGSKK